MKSAHLLLLLFLCQTLFFSSFSQTTLILEQNNTSIKLSDNGVFFHDPVEMGPACEIPKASGKNTLFAMGLWMTGLDENDSLRGSCTTFNSDFFPGPIADAYDAPYYTDMYSSAIWSVSKTAIEYHRANYTSADYTLLPSIGEWPGNGVTDEGEAEQLAPYVDVNGDMIYDPMDGDYPYIQGDKAVYVIMNDEAETHPSGLDSLGIEVHVMFYQFAESTGELSETTFMNAKVYNRSSTDYHDLRFGLFTDYDLGNYEDDFIGSDSVRNMTYVYNGASSDSIYGSNPPAFGTKLLNQNMQSAMYTSAVPGATGDPSLAAHYHNYMNSMWKNDQHLLYGGNGFDVDTTSIESEFAYSGNPNSGSGWSEITAGNVPADRRMVMATDDLILNKGDYFCADVAFIYSDDGGDQLANVDSLKSVADKIQTYYDDNIHPCNAIFVGTEDNYRDNTKIKIFPNPTNGDFVLELTESAEIEIVSMKGDRMFQTTLSKGVNQLSVDLSSGLYLLKVISSDRIVTERFIIRE